MLGRGSPDSRRTGARRRRCCARCGVVHAGRVAAETGVTRTTVDWIVTEFEARGWAERTAGGEYAATPTSARVAREFTDFLRTMASIETLGDVVAWLPTDEVPIELSAFADATILRPDPADPMANSTYVTELLRESSEFACLVSVAPPLAFKEAMRDGVTERDLATNHVITDEEYRYLRAYFRATGAMARVPRGRRERLSLRGSRSL